MDVHPRHDQTPAPTHRHTDHDPDAAAPQADHSHAGHAGHSPEHFRRPFWVSLILTVPILYYAHLFQDLFGYRALALPGSDWLPLVLGSVIYFYGGWVFLTGAVGEVRGRQPGMMTLVAMAITVAYLYSVAITFGLVGGMDFFWELATLVTIMLLGHWMEVRAVGNAQSALNELAKLLPDTAERLKGDQIEVVPVSALQVDDRVLVRPGTAIPADGEVVTGASVVNEAMVTGESRPVRKASGSQVIGGTVNGAGALRVRVTRVGDQTALAGIMRLVAQAQTGRTRTQALADRAAGWLVYIALGTALLTALVWSAARGFDNVALERVVTVLVVACPHALGLAIPLVTAISTTLAARSGILVSDRKALEEARTVTTVVFDKTGTLTRGEQGLVGVITVIGNEDEALALTAAVEADSEHLIAHALLAEARGRGLVLPPVEGFTALPGRGVQARHAGRRVQVGGPRLLEQIGLALPVALAEKTRQWGGRGQSVVYLIDDGQVRAAFALADVIRPESRPAITALRERGVRVAMLTGDSQAVAYWVAGELGIDTVLAEVLPEHKSDRVRELQAAGERVAMVGDGVNDAPALAQADIGIAIGAGTDVARASAGIVLVRNDPRDIARILTLSRATYAKMVQNLWWAAGYNVISLPLAAGVLAPFGFVLPMWVGAVQMSVSTIVVALNAQTLRGLRLTA